MKTSICGCQKKKKKARQIIVSAANARCLDLKKIILANPTNSSMSNSDAQPKEMPEHLRTEYTMDNRIPVVTWYFPPPTLATNTLHYSEQLCSRLLETAKRERQSRTSGGAVKYTGPSYPQTDPFVHAALERFGVGRKILVIGSVDPWYEAMSLAYNCAACTVVEYGKRTCGDARLEYLQQEQFQEALQQGRRWDVVLSISSIEHDGLGRYGDPLNPTADLEHMKQARAFLTEDGVYILAVPIGKDKVVWNAHRIYGKLRLPLLLQGWNVVACFGISGLQDRALDRDTGKSGSYQPVFVLQPSKNQVQ
jgi:hypothetical protein